MYIKYNDINYPCKSFWLSNQDTLTYGGLPEDFPTIVTGDITVYSDDDFEMRKDTVENYQRQSFKNGVLTLTNKPEPETIVPEVSLETQQQIKISQISKSCNEAIISGVDVETTQGVEHFSLEETDQINLNAALQAVQQGATSYPYHADKQLCRMFTAEEIIAVVQASTQHKIYHTTLCNHLLVWIRRVETKEELETITYSAENLPEDLQANMQAVIADATEVLTTEMI